MIEKKIHNIEELLIALYYIGKTKSYNLVLKKRGWVNILGLYVQLEIKSGLISYGANSTLNKCIDLYGDIPETREYLFAGGKFKKYFYAFRSTCPELATLDDDDDYEDRVKRRSEDIIRLRHEVYEDFNLWEVKKFDSQVWEQRFAHLVEPTCEIAWYVANEEEQSQSKFMSVVGHFKSNREWLGFYQIECASCGRSTSWWDYFCLKTCPFCGGKIVERNREQ